MHRFNCRPGRATELYTRTPLFQMQPLDGPRNVSDDISVLLNPGIQVLIAVTFDQDYRSINFTKRTRKRQFRQE
jgi:hypothetical protein